MNIKYMRDEIPQFEMPRFEGERYKLLVPDTLDLAERMRLAVNGLTGATDPEADHEIYFRVSFIHNPPVMWHDSSDICITKFMESLPLMRIGSGSDLNLHVDRRWMESALRSLGPDGLYYWSPRPWGHADFTKPGENLEHVAIPMFNGRLLGAMTLYSLRDPNGPWQEACRRIVDGLCAAAVDRGDWAYFPRAYGGMAPGGGRPREGKVLQGIFACWASAWIIQGCVQHYRAFGYEPARVLSGKLARYLVDHGRYYGPDGSFLRDWPDDKDIEGNPIPSSDTYITDAGSAHFHLHALGLLALLEYAMTVKDKKLLEFVGSGYRHARSKGNPLIGYFPEDTVSPRQETSETCEVADMIALAIALSLAGEGEYWDDAERYLRNQFAENQITTTHWFDSLPRRMVAEFFPLDSRARALPELKPPESKHMDRVGFTTDRVAERNMGCFAGWPAVNDWGSGIMQCCTGNGSRTLYYAWEHILSFTKGVISVNLLLNRASPWADVSSHLPYVGQVDVRLKQEAAVKIRIPEWVEPGTADCTVNEARRDITYEGRYAMIGRVRAGDEIILKFPIQERSVEIWVQKHRYSLVVKGYEVVDIDPPGRSCPLYRRDHYRRNYTMWRKVERFVSEEQVEWLGAGQRAPAGPRIPA